MRQLIAITFAFCAFLYAASAVAETGNVLHVEEKDIVNAIRQEFVDRGMAESKKLDVELFGGQTDFQVEGAKEAKVIINNLKADEKLGRFTCDAEIFADRISVATSALQGKYFPLSTVWVPTKNISKGEIVTKDKLRKETIRQSKLKPFMVTDSEKLIGQEAQRSLKEGKIISENDISAPVLVRKNDIVIAVYRTDRMQITTKAIAQQDGAYGERIEVQNAKTRKVLTGVVQDASTVVIDQ